MARVDTAVWSGVISATRQPGFQVWLDSTVYLPEDWANDPARRKKLTCQRKSSSAPSKRSHWTKSISLLSNGVRFSALTFDELYGRDGKFLDGLETRQQLFVGEIPSDFHGWLESLGC